MEKPLIMIADDAMFMRRVIKRALTQGGYDNFVEAGDGVEAVEKYKEVQPDLMLLDITMPGRSGLEVLNDILAECKGHHVLGGGTGAGDCGGDPLRRLRLHYQAI